jgi:uncharacterized protein
MRADPARKIVATEAALAAIGRLRAEHGPLMFFQSGGCCDGSSPMCFPEGELLVGPNDLLLDEVDSCPFYIDAEQYRRWNRPSFVLDVAAGEGSGLSLEGVHGFHFVAGPAPDTRHSPDARPDGVPGARRSASSGAPGYAGRTQQLAPSRDCTHHE